MVQLSVFEKFLGKKLDPYNYDTTLKNFKSEDKVWVIEGSALMEKVASAIEEWQVVFLNEADGGFYLKLFKETENVHS